MKRIIKFGISSVLSVLLILASGCASDPDIDLSQVMIDGVHAADDAFSRNDAEAYASHLTEDFVHDNVTGEPSPRTAFIEMVEGFFTSFPGVKNYQKDLLPSGTFLIFDECTFDIPIAGTGAKKDEAGKGPENLPNPVE